MKRHTLDRFIGFFSPAAEAKRAMARFNLERAYDVAKTYKTSDWISSTNSSANAELKNAIGPGRQKARALVQNNPYAIKALNVIVNETVGTGIKLQLSGPSRSTKELSKLWSEWAESTSCDFEGKSDFYALQSLMMKSVVESGEGLGLKEFAVDGTPKIKLLEPDHLDSQTDSGDVVQGVELKNGIPSKYHIFKVHPGDRFASTEKVILDASKVLHAFKKDRIGQVRGITWYHGVVEKLKDFDDFQYSTLIGRKIAACLVGAITTNGNDSLANAADLKAKRESENLMQPGQWRYLAPGESVQFSSPPKADGYSDFNRETLRAVASGLGVSYESMTGDYSQSNYSSSRMGHIQMHKNVEAWQWNIIVPHFCEPSFQMFLTWAKTRGIDTKDIKHEWVPQAFSMIDPEKEIAAMKAEIRNGLTSYGAAVLSRGYDPEKTLLDIEKWNKEFDTKGIALDIDPRKLSQAGLAQANNTAGSSEEPTDDPADKENDEQSNENPPTSN